MSIQVKSIDVYGIEDRLRKDKSPEAKEIWQYIKALKESYQRQGDLVKKAMTKIRQQAEEIQQLKIKNG